MPGANGPPAADDCSCFGLSRVRDGSLARARVFRLKQERLRDGVSAGAKSDPHGLAEGAPGLEPANGVTGPDERGQRAIGLVL